MDLLTIKEISRELEVPESNLRYYRDRFEDFLPSVGQGRKRRYKKGALDVFRFIVQGFQNDKTSDQIAEELPKHFSRKPDLTDHEETPSRVYLARTEGEESQTSVYQLLHNQARTLERFSRFLFSRREPSEAAENIKSDHRKLKKGVILLNRDVQRLKSSLDNHPLTERCSSLEDETAHLKQEIAATQNRLAALEAESREHQDELRSALQECLHLMRRILESEQPD
ncbi:MAG: MerR family transcriptional regulator [Thermodesulfobacteriota bacterium]